MLGQHGLGMCGGSGGDVVVAVQARDFFDEVLFDVQVESIRRRRHHEVIAVARESETKSPEDLADGVGVDGYAKNSRDTRRAHAHRIASGQGGAYVDQFAGAAAAEFEDQMRGTVHRRRPDCKVDTTFEPEASVRRKTQSPRLALDDRWVPERAFEEHRGGRVTDAAVFAAHDAGKPQRLLLVGDQ